MVWRSMSEILCLEPANDLSYEQSVGPTHAQDPRTVHMLFHRQGLSKVFLNIFDMESTDSLCGVSMVNGQAIYFRIDCNRIM